MIISYRDMLKSSSQIMLLGNSSKRNNPTITNVEPVFIKKDNTTTINELVNTNIDDNADNINDELDMQIQLPEYERIKIVGQGSFGVAILYKKRSDQSVVVLKQIHLSNLTQSEKEMAMNEVEVFSKLHHPNIICYLGNFIRSNVLIIEMEYADGGTLAQVLAKRSIAEELMPERNIINILEQITSAINYMHSENILHRDLKTANVFLNRRCIVKIGDFGISKIMNTKIHAQTVLGTPYYFSPEMCEGKDYDNKSDIWALGCVLGEMCCLKKAFAATNLSELVAKIMSAQYIPLPSAYSEGIKSLMRILLQVDSSKRPTAMEVLQYWIPLVYRNLHKSQGYDIKSGFDATIDTQSTSSKQSTTLTSLTSSVSLTQEEQQLMNTSTTNLDTIRVERSVLYQLKSFAGETDVSPLQLPPNIKISHVAHSSAHFLVVTSEGLVYSWGESNKGQLGHGNVEIWKHYPNRIDSIKKHKIIDACAGDGFSIFLNNFGMVLSCGDNSNGCLGQIDEKNLQFPKIIDSLKNIRIVQISSGPQHVMAIDDTLNNLYSWGTCKNGGLGQGNKKTYCPKPQLIVQELFGDKILKLICGPECSFVILANGELYATGDNQANRLGLGKQINNTMNFKKVDEIKRKVLDVSVSTTHTILLIDGGYVLTMGRNNYGQRGLGHRNEIDEPMLVTGIKDKYITKIKCCSTYSLVYSEENIISLWGTRSGIPGKNDLPTKTKKTTKFKQENNDNFELGNSTAAFTNFLASVYKTEIIFDPIDILALYASPEQIIKGCYLKLTNIYPLHHSILVLVDTTTTLGSNYLNVSSTSTSSN